MEPAEFKRILDLGLGRAILHLQNHDATPYRDAILNACLHNTVFDTQLESAKDAYMMDILELTGEMEFYRDQILGAARRITDNTNERDVYHLLNMTQNFAHTGDQEARKIIYDKFIASLSTEFIWCVSRIVEMDGLNGFIFVADRLGEFALNNPSYTDDDQLLWEIEDQLGKEESAVVLSELRQSNPRIDAYLEVMERDRKNPQRYKTPNTSKWSYAKVKRFIDENKKVNTRAWGKFTTEENLREAAVDLLQIPIDDLKRLYKYLEIFQFRVFPLDHRKLFELVENENWRLSHSASKVLANISHSSVRKFALKLIQNGKYLDQGVELLQKNFADGDWTLLEALTLGNYEKMEHHHLEMSIQAVFDENPAKEAAKALLNLYEYAPCSFCREGNAARLHSINMLPENIHEECKYDGNLYLRERARANFVEKPDQ